MALKMSGAIDVLRLLADGGSGMEAGQIAQALELSATQAARILDALLQQSLLERNDSRFALGPGALALAVRLRGHFTLEKLARPIMLSLVQQTGEAVTLNVYSRGLRRGVCMAVQESDAHFQYAIEAGEIKPLHAGASGKTILAFLSDDEREAVLGDGHLAAVTPCTTCDVTALRMELQVIRDQGHAVTHGERVPGAVGIGVPVTTPEQKPGSLVLTVPEYRFEEAHMARLVALAKEHAHALDELFRSLR